MIWNVQPRSGLEGALVSSTAKAGGGNDLWRPIVKGLTIDYLQKKTLNNSTLNTQLSRNVNEQISILDEPIISREYGLIFYPAFRPLEH